MKRKRILLLALGIFVVSFVACGGTGLLVYKVVHTSDTGVQAKATSPATTAPSGPTAPRPTEPAKSTVPKTVPKATVPVPTDFFGPKKGQMPPEAELRQIVIGTLLDLDGAIKKKDVTLFQSKMSAYWQTDQGKKDVQAFYQGLSGNLAPVKDASPMFKPAPALGGDGVLFLKGQIPAKGIKVDFQFGYVFEQGMWKLKDIGQLDFEQMMGN